MDGWRCPACGAGNAPWKATCGACKPAPLQVVPRGPALPPAPAYPPQTPRSPNMCSARGSSRGIPMNATGGLGMMHMALVS